MNDISSTAATLALSPPLILGSVSDVKSEDPNAGVPLVGAPLRLTEKGFLQVVVDPSFPPAEALRLYHNDKRIDAPSEVDAQGRTRFRVSRVLLREGVQAFHYEAERVGGNSEVSPKLWVLYSLNRPGGRDPFGGNDYQDNLKIDMPEAIKKLGVGPEEAAQGIPLTVSYPFAKLHDVVEINCNGYRFTYTVTQNDLGGSFDIPIPEKAFNEGGSSENFLISYTVWDQLENYTQDGLPSIALSIVVDLQPKEMDRPDLIEDMAGAEDEVSSIDRSSLKDFLLARVHVRTPLWKKGDSVRLTYTCVPAEGAPVTRTLADVLVNRVPDFLELKIPAALVIAAAWLIVSYSLVRGGVVLASSYATKSEVVGGGSSELPLPFVPGLVGNNIVPTKYPDGFTVRVDLATGWKVGDKAKLVVTGGASGAGTPVFGFIQFNANQRANFKFSREFILANANLEVKFTWVLLRDGKETESQPLNLTVERINAEDPNFPSAEIPQSNGTDVVDLRLFDGDARVVCAQWPFIRVGQAYWLQIDGTDLEGNRRTYIITDGARLTQVQVEKGLDHVLPRNELILFKPGYQLTVHLRVDLYPNENADTIVTFLLTHYTLVTAGMYDTLEFLNGPYRVAPAGRLTNIELRAVNKNGDYIDGATVYITIPSGFKYKDGVVGRRAFKTDAVGKISISGVTAPDAPATHYTIQAELEGKIFTSKLHITARGKVGELNVSGAISDLVLSPDGTRVYALCGVSDFSTVDSETLTAVGSAVKDVRGHFVAITPDSSRAIVSSAYGNNTIAINVLSSEKIASISSRFTMGQGVFGLDGHYGYFGSNLGFTVVDAVHLREEKNLYIYAFSWNNFVRRNFNGQRVFICQQYHKVISIYDVTSHQVVKTSTPFSSEPGGFDIAGHLYVCFPSENKVRSFNEDLNEVRMYEVGNKPGVIVLASDGGLAFYGSLTDKKVRVFSPISGLEVSVYDVRGVPACLALSPDNKRLFVGYKDTAKLTVIQVG